MVTSTMENAKPSAVMATLMIYRTYAFLHVLTPTQVTTTAQLIYAFKDVLQTTIL